jgi:hypothetical protein
VCMGGWTVGSTEDFTGGAGGGGVFITSKTTGFENRMGGKGLTLDTTSRQVPPLSYRSTRWNQSQGEER